MPKSEKAGDGCRFPFHWTQSNALVAGIFGLALDPSSFPRVLTEADGWDYFRLVSVRFRLHPPNANTGPQYAGYVCGVQDTPPGSGANVTELVYSTVLGGGSTNPTGWVKISRKDLAGPFPWYKSVRGAADPTEETPGAIYVAGTGTDQILLEISGVIEFKSAVATANTPAAARALEVLRQERVKAAREVRRGRLVQALSPAPTVVAGFPSAL